MTSLERLSGMHTLEYLRLNDTPVTDITAICPLVRSGLSVFGKDVSICQ